MIRTLKNAGIMPSIIFLQIILSRKNTEKKIKR